MKLDLQEIRASDDIASLDESRKCSSPDKSLARTSQRPIPQPIVRELSLFTNFTLRLIFVDLDQGSTATTRRDETIDQ